MFDFFTLYILQSVNAKKLKEVCTKYIYDRCPAMAVVGKENLHCIYYFVIQKQVRRICNMEV